MHVISESKIAVLEDHYKNSSKLALNGNMLKQLF